MMQFKVGFPAVTHSPGLGFFDGDLPGPALSRHLDAICRTASALFHTRFASVSLLNAAGQRYMGRTGFMEEGTPPGVALCEVTICKETYEPLIVLDTHQDARFRDNVLVVAGPHLRFYAGIPIKLGNRHNAVTVCVADPTPRVSFDAAEVARLLDLALFVEEALRGHVDRLEAAEASRRAEEAFAALQESEGRFRALAEHTSDIIILSDLDTTRRYVSPSVTSVLGYPSQAWVGTQPLDFVHPEDLEGYTRVLAEVSSGRRDRVLTCQRYRHADGHWIWVEVLFSLIRDTFNKEPQGYIATLRDVSERKAIEGALQISEERLALALDSGEDGLWDWDLATDEVLVSEQWRRMLGYTEEGLNTNLAFWCTAIHSDDRARVVDAFADHVKGRTSSLSCEHRLIRRDGTELWVLTRGRIAAREENGRPRRLVGTQIDISRRKSAEMRIQHMALHDALTGLPNRTLFRDRLEQVVAGSARSGCPFAVLACDLDRFKGVNDGFGHPAGDTLLRVVAERMRDIVLHPSDTVARLGGDEFAVILTRLDEKCPATHIAERLTAAVGQPIEIDGKHVEVSLSIGLIVASGQEAHPDELFKRADMALYEAKAGGRGTIRVFRSDSGERLSARSQLGLDMKDAMRRGEFYLVYQPVVNVETGEVVSFEALMRWRHAVHGDVSPKEFISLAEETGLILQLGRWALLEACREAMNWPTPIKVAVNVSAVQLHRDDLEAAVCLALADSGLAANRLKIEVTESVMMRNASDVMDCLRRLREIGVRIALDDFGTGYSSLSYLRRAPFDKIKIDRAFIREITDPAAAAIVRAVVYLGERLGMGVVAEGVETEEQLQLVKREGCSEVQGFLFSRPLPPQEARAFISRRRQAA